MTGTGSVLKVSGRATLTIQDSSAAKSGTITGGNAVDGGGVYIDNNATLKMTGGCITDCHATRGGGGIYSYGNLYMGGTAKIENIAQEVTMRFGTGRKVTYMPMAVQWMVR